MAIKNVNKPLKGARHGCFAHFPGTGPPATHCAGCGFFDNPSEMSMLLALSGLCLKWKELQQQQNRKLPKIGKNQYIASNTPSCRYYVERKNERKKS